jgi:peptide/nickel transport system ATP-binding protein
MTTTDWSPPSVPSQGATDTPVLRVRDLSVTYRSRRSDVTAVRSVDFELRRGEMLGVAGESGCGKSTMAMALLKLLPPEADVTGTIELDGADVLAMTPGQLRAVRWAKASVVFQGAQHVLNPVRTVGQQIAEARRSHKMDVTATTISELFEQVGLPARRSDAYPHELSGGQRQRVMIAMALACDPLVLIADEPTTALDVMVQAQVLDVMQQIQRDRGLSTIFITHDLSVLDSVADRVAVMYAGRIVEEGPAHEVLRTPNHPYSKALAAAFPTVGEQASRFAPAGLPGDPPDPAELPSGCSFHPRCPDRIAACSSAAIELRPVGSDRRSACLLAGSQP